MESGQTRHDYHDRAHSLGAIGQIMAEIHDSRPHAPWTSVQTGERPVLLPVTPMAANPGGSTDDLSDIPLQDKSPNSQVVDRKTATRERTLFRGECSKKVLRIRHFTYYKGERVELYICEKHWREIATLKYWIIRRKYGREPDDRERTDFQNRYSSL